MSTTIGQNTTDLEALLNQANNLPEVDLTGYATEEWVQEGFQPKGDYLESAELSNAIDTALAQSTHATDKNNPHEVTKAQVGLDKVDNTSDAKKPVSTKQGEAIANACPRNLLDNSYFIDPVNQRGETTYSKSVYTIDRWKLSSTSATLTVGAGYITINNGCLLQVLERYDEGTSYTLVVEEENGNVSCESHEFQAGDSSDTDTTFCLLDGMPTVRLAAGSYKRVALYRGTFDINVLPVYQPKGYGAELQECMRYFRRFSTSAIVPYVGHITGTSRIVFMVGYAPFRVAPTPEMSSDFKIAVRLATGGYSTLTSSGGAKPESIVGVYGNSGQRAVYFEMGSSPGTNNMLVSSTIAGGYLDLHADL